jgi:phage tail sheath protein FI
MPVTLTFPGVYIEELGSGVHTITGVATSITAFIGRAERGLVNRPITITSLGDFVRNFGSPNSTLGSAVQDFYLNGGSQAIIVRLHHPGAGNAFARLSPGGLPLRAWTEGAWANNLVAIVDPFDVSDSKAKDLKVAADQLFNLIVIEPVDNAEAVKRVRAAVAKGFVKDAQHPNAPDITSIKDAVASIKAADVASIEKIRNLTLVDSERRFDRTLKAESNLVRSNVPDPFTPPLPKAVAGFDQPSTAQTPTPAVADIALTPADFFPANPPKTGVFALDDADLFNILCIPDIDASNDAGRNLVDLAAAYCETHRAMLVVDAPWTTVQAAVEAMSTGDGVGTTSKNAALFFPRYKKPNQGGSFPVCGAVAGVFARTDSERGVWKAPAGTEATLRGVPELSVHLTDAENGLLNPLGVNCLREFPAAGRVIWGSRTLQGDDRQASEWKYIPVRRTALFIEESLFRGTKWVVFEPNDEPLWAQIRLNLGAFMNSLFRQGAFQGKTPREAYFVKCDRETTTQDDINRGVVNIVVGFAPLKPAEFVIIQIQQIAGQIQV